MRDGVAALMPAVWLREMASRTSLDDRRQHVPAPPATCSPGEAARVALHDRVVATCGAGQLPGETACSAGATRVAGGSLTGVTLRRQRDSVAGSTARIVVTADILCAWTPVTGS